MGKALFYRQIEVGIESAYEDAGATMACNMMDPSALEGVQAFIEKRPPSWSVARGQDASFARDADRGGSGDCPAVARHETP